MAKRYTDTDIWIKQRWFKKLEPSHKLVWKYLTDRCNHAGIWKIDYAQLIDDTGIDGFDLSSFIDSCNTDFDPKNGKKISRERIKLIEKFNILWITGFIQFQYEGKEFSVNPRVPAIKSALEILHGYKTLTEGLQKGYITLTEPFKTVS